MNAVYVYPVNGESACETPLTFVWRNIFEKAYYNNDGNAEETGFFYAVHIFKQSDSTLVYSTLNDHLMLTGTEFEFVNANDYLEEDNTYFWRLQVFFDNQRDSVFAQIPFTSDDDLANLSSILYDVPEIGKIYATTSHALLDAVIPFYQYVFLLSISQLLGTAPPVTTTNFVRCACSPPWGDNLPGIKCATP
ncbi:MAG: hypothetical protein KF690_05245 [Bacteroidetes bacterium]|nr:hypothetical protein [Bacteroidota bacterium]